MSAPEATAMPADPMVALRAQLALQAQDNPGLALLLQLLEQRAPAAQPAADDAAEAEDPSDPFQPIDAGDLGGADLCGPMRADVQALLGHCSAMETELDLLRRRNDGLAAALGACYLCFGEDPGCARCAGRGRPGARRPEGASFRRYVQPLLQRLPGLRPPPAAPARSLRPAPAGAVTEPPGSVEGLRARAVPEAGAPWADTSVPSSP